jgi:hypothetical protein
MLITARYWLGPLASALPIFLVAGAHDPEHLALLFADEIVEGHSRLVVGISGFDGSPGGALGRLYHYVVNMIDPRDPVVRIRVAS